MNKALAWSIFGMGLTGAILIVSVAQSFNPPIGNILKIVIISSTVAFIMFAISALIIRKHLNKENK